MFADEPSDEPCDAISGQARELCENGGGGGGPATSPTDSLDPLTTLAQEVARAAAWTAEKLGTMVGDRAAVDLTDAGFLRQYALVFAATTVLVLLLWLLAVVKRTVRGVPFGTAFGEAVGLLWLAVAATAFTPLVLYTVIAASSALTDALAAGLGGSSGKLFTDIGTQLTEGKVGGGPLMLILVSLATIALCGALMLLLVLRVLGLYVGAVLGVVVYAGLVDRDLWRHVRRWAGMMVALILIEPIVVIVLGLASALQSSSSDAVTGLAVTVVALGAAIALITKTPGAGDALRAARLSGRAAGAATGAVTGTVSASRGVMHGIHTHGDRGGGPSSSAGTGSVGVQSRTSGTGGVSGGIAADSQRSRRINGTPAPQQRQSKSPNQDV